MSDTFSNKTLERAGEAASEFASQTGARVAEAARNFGCQADDMASDAGRGIEKLGHRVRKSLPKNGMFGGASRSVAKSIEEGGEYLADSKLSGVAGDFGELIRRYPFASMCVGVALVLWLARRW